VGADSRDGELLRFGEARAGVAPRVMLVAGPRDGGEDQEDRPGQGGSGRRAPSASCVVAGRPWVCPLPLHANVAGAVPGV
jgi:hypothetical protein